MPMQHEILWPGYHAPQTIESIKVHGRQVSDVILYIPEAQYANARKFFLARWPFHDGCLVAPKNLNLRCNVFEHEATQSDPLKKILPNTHAQSSAERLYIFAGRGTADGNKSRTA